jgi:hypothetical protein
MSPATPAEVAQDKKPQYIMDGCLSCFFSNNEKDHSLYSLLSNGHVTLIRA